MMYKDKNILIALCVLSGAISTSELASKTYQPYDFYKFRQNSYNLRFSTPGSHIGN